MAKDIAMMDMSELRTELERSRRYTTRLQTRFDKLNVEVTHQANMTLKAIEERDEAVAMLLAKAKSEEGAREDSENRARQLRAEIAQLKTDLDKRDRRFKQLTPIEAVVTEEFTRMRKEVDAARRADPNAGPPAPDDDVTASAVTALCARLEKATALEKECDDLRKINAFLRRQGGGSLDSSGGSGGISAAVESVMKESEDVIAALNRDGVKAEEVPLGSNTEKWRQVAMAFSGSLGKESPPASPGALGGVLPPPPAEGDGGDDAPMSAAEVARSMDSLRSSILKPQSVRTSGLGARVGVRLLLHHQQDDVRLPGCVLQDGRVLQDDHPPRRWIRDQGSKRPPAATDAHGRNLRAPEGTLPRIALQRQELAQASRRRAEAVGRAARRPRGTRERAV